MNTEKKSRGGRREGAGRKPAGTVRMEIRVKPETEAKLRALAVEGKTLGEVIDAKFSK